jgi:uncharacterized protein YcbK (DUF882 family)
MALERQQLSPHFDLAEFHSKDGVEVPETHEKALRDLCRKVLEPMRRKFGVCSVHSGYRTEARNRAVGGARNSYHRYDIHDAPEVAADVSFARGNPTTWRTEARRLLASKYGKNRGGLGRYLPGGFLHIDTRKNGRVEWEGT